jgi:hypothetical protein
MWQQNSDASIQDGFPVKSARPPCSFESIGGRAEFEQNATSQISGFVSQ